MMTNFQADYTCKKKNQTIPPTFWACHVSFFFLPLSQRDLKHVTLGWQQIQFSPRVYTQHAASIEESSPGQHSTNKSDT